MIELNRQTMNGKDQERRSDSSIKKDKGDTTGSFRGSNDDRGEVHIEKRRR